MLPLRAIGLDTGSVPGVLSLSAFPLSGQRSRAAHTEPERIKRA